MLGNNQQHRNAEICRLFYNTCNDATQRPLSNDHGSVHTLHTYLWQWAVFCWSPLWLALIIHHVKAHHL